MTVISQYLLWCHSGWITIPTHSNHRRNFHYGPSSHIEPYVVLGKPERLRVIWFPGMNGRFPGPWHTRRIEWSGCRHSSINSRKMIISRISRFTDHIKPDNEVLHINPGSILVVIICQQCLLDDYTNCASTLSPGSFLRWSHYVMMLYTVRNACQRSLVCYVRSITSRL